MPTHSPIKPSSFRFTPRVLDVADQIADTLGTNRTTAFTLGITLLSEHLGIKQLDAVAAVEEITRTHGDSTPITVTVTSWDSATIEIAGQPAPNWTAWPLVSLGEDGQPSSKLGFYARWEPRRVTFALGETADPEIGGQLTIPSPSELLDLVLLRTKRDSDKTPAERRAELRAEFQLRREISHLLAKTGLDPVVGGDEPDDGDDD